MESPAQAISHDWASALPHDEEVRSGKRSRVALACQRCKARKQKCNGMNPCSKCKSFDVQCEYVIPQKPMPFGKNQYIKSLERRVAELETVLAKQGMSELSNDHWSTPKGGLGNHDAEDQHPAVDHSDSQAHTPDSDEEQEDLDWQDGASKVVSVLRSLSLDANGTNYIGASSTITMGKLFSFLGQRRMRSRTTSQLESGRHVLFPPAPSVTKAQDAVEPIEFSQVPPEIADHLLKGYIKHISTRFPVLHSPWVRDVHKRRLSLTSDLEHALLHLVYATGGRFIETTGEFGAFYPKRHWTAALRSLDSILDCEDIKSVSALLLMAVYCLRDPVGPGAWTYSRLAMVVAIDLGLHRKTNAMKRVSLDNEIRKRVFWALYSFDRQISIPLGRPFALGDRDIDVPLPLEVEESITAERLAQLQHLEPVEMPSATREKSTSLSSFIHLSRMRRLESEIQQTVYRVDQIPDISDAVLDQLLNKLDTWKKMIPLDAYKMKDVDGVPFDGYNLPMVYYCKAKRLLLYSQISKDPVNPRYLKECAMACAGVCANYKRLHQSMAVGYSVLALQTVFMAGLTLVYCIWISPEDIFDLTTSNGIHDCSIVLFVIAERVPAAKKYRNASRPFEVDHDSFEQFSQIISEMSGEMHAFPNTFMSDFSVDSYSVALRETQLDFMSDTTIAPALIGQEGSTASVTDYQTGGAVDDGCSDSLPHWLSAGLSNGNTS